MAANRLTEVCKNYLVAYDKLTGLYSRERFYEKAKELLRACPAMDFVVICSNIGSFKMINDIYGNQEGNALLCSLAARLRDMRLVHAVYGRLESDKFAICMSAAEYHASGFAQIYTRVSLPRHRAMSIMNYIGVYAVDDRTLPIGIMCDRAMMALNTLKGSYEKQVAYYDESLRQEILREQKIVQGLQQALQEQHFELYLQPQVDVRSGRLLGAEALVRWKHPVWGLVPPGQFIPILEKNGLITKLDFRVWDMACRLLKRWQQEGRPAQALSVNISPRDFYFADVYRIFANLLRTYEISPGCLHLEITESGFAIAMLLKRGAFRSRLVTVWRMSAALKIF